MSKVDKLCYWMDQFCRVLNIGYSQPDRWNIWDGGEMDCSSATYEALWRAELLKRPANVWSRSWYTGTVYNDCVAAGFRSLSPVGKPRRGTVLLKSGHVAVCINDSGTIAEAYASEHGSKDGSSGDQTGWETREVSWNYTSWSYYLVPPESAYEEPKPEPEPEPEPPKPTPVPKREPGEGLAMRTLQGKLERLYNPYNGDHLYTVDTDESKSLVKNGYKAEGDLGTTPKDMVVVYRLYNVDTGEHLFTTDYDEAQKLSGLSSNMSDGKKNGWQVEGEPFIAYAKDSGPVPVYRLFAPDHFHFFTADSEERDTLIKNGYDDEGIAFSLDV